jgi:hypothetical protein
MRPARIVSLVIGCLLVFPALGMLLGGGALGVGYVVARDDQGYFDVTLDRFESDTAAVMARDLGFTADPASPAWLLDRIDATVRLRATSAGPDDVFVGIGPTRSVDEYLAGVAHDEVVEVTGGQAPVYRSMAGADDAPPPTEQDFWAASSTGPGEQELTWKAARGRWSAVVMNASGEPGVLVDVNVGVRSDIVLPLIVGLLVAGAVLTALAITLIVVGATGATGATGANVAAGTSGTTETTAAAGPPPPLPPPSPVTGHQVPLAPPAPSAADPERRPVVLTAQLAPELSRWLWLVKWFLAIPHFIVLGVLWIGFVVLTVVAAVAILFTGRYPRSIFDFNVGVLRWTWRVSYYATTGGIGTDRYPPFSLAAEPGDAAHLDVAYPERLTRWLVLVKWFLAIPHLIIVGLLVGGGFRWTWVWGEFRLDPFGGGFLGLLVLVAGVMLLFTGRYPTGLFNLIIGLNRWVYRVIVYVALMTDRYPPFHLDQGGDEEPALDEGRP